MHRFSILIDGVARTNTLFYNMDSLKDFINILAGSSLPLPPYTQEKNIWGVAGFEPGPRA